MAERASVVERAERRADELARLVVERVLDVVPAYAELRDQPFGEEYLDIARHNVDRLLGHLGTDGEPYAHVDEVRGVAIRRAEDGVPLHAHLQAYHVLAATVWEWLLGEAEPEETAAVLAAAPRAFSYLRQVSGAVAEAYLEEREALSAEERDARRALLEALLDGQPIDDAGSRHGILVAPQLVVLAVAFGSSPDERPTWATWAMAARHKQRRIEEHLAALRDGRDAIHTLLDPAGGTVLVPADDPTEVDLDQLVAGIATAGRCDVWAGAAWAASHAAAPGAVTQARQVLRLVREGERPPGGYHLVDVLLDHLVSQPGAAGPLLGLLQPLEAGSELLETLESWFEHDFDRRATAAALMIHPNTLDYRIRRISELTGLDLRTAEAIQLLGAALLAGRQAEPPDAPAV